MIPFGYLHLPFQSILVFKPIRNTFSAWLTNLFPQNFIFSPEAVLQAVLLSIHSEDLYIFQTLH